MLQPHQFRNPMLIVCHPGHELRLFGWLNRYKPRVLVLTDGSGHRDHSRLPSSERLLDDLKVPIGGFFGRIADRKLYDLMLERTYNPLIDFAEEMAEEMICHETTEVVGDMAEGEICAHDTGRLLIDAAIEIVRQRTSRTIRRLCFPVVGSPLAGPGGRPVIIRLDEETVQRKLAAARAYPEIRAEVETAIETFGERAFASEFLFPAPPSFALPAGTPAYERYGLAQVERGRYAKAIRFDSHVEPLIAALQVHVRGAHRCAA